jgi:rhodanese-related sulfurtransferase
MSNADLSPDQVEQLVADGAQLVDVRENYEHEAGHIPGDEHIPFDELPLAASRFQRDKPVVFYCRVGNRSAVAVELFGASGFDARHLAGGLAAWVEKGKPIEPKDGEVAPH